MISLIAHHGPCKDFLEEEIRKRQQPQAAPQAPRTTKAESPGASFRHPQDFRMVMDLLMEHGYLVPNGTKKYRWEPEDKKGSKAKLAALVEYLSSKGYLSAKSNDDFFWLICQEWGVEVSKRHFAESRVHFQKHGNLFAFIRQLKS